MLWEQLRSSQMDIISQMISLKNTINKKCGSGNKMNIYSCWLPSIYDAKENHHCLLFSCTQSLAEQRRVHCGCVGGQGSLIANRDDGFTFLISSSRKLSSVIAAKWIYGLDWTYRRVDIKNIEFQQYIYLPFATVTTVCRITKTKFIYYRTRKTLDVGQFICLLRPSMDDFTFRLTGHKRK